MDQNEERIQRLRERGIPEYAIVKKKKVSDNPTNALQDEIIAYAKRLGAAGARINTMGIYSTKLKKYIRSGATLGVSDIILCMPPKGTMICVEVKRGSDRIRPDQAKFQQMIQQAKGHYIIVSDMESFKAQFNSLIKSI
jgi:hypothetical protein